MNFIDLFSGAGGFARGFVEAGFKPILAIDINPYCVLTYTRNFKDCIMLNIDIRRIHAKDIINLVGYPDVVIASPPCEAFTLVSRNIMKDPLDRLYTDPRGRLTLKAIELIGDLRPTVFIIENVPGILTQPIPRYIEDEFKRFGYSKIYFNILHAEDYGCPSRRTRVFISNIKIKPEKIKKKFRVWDVISDLPDPRYPSNIPNHEYIRIPPRFEKRVHRLKWGEGLNFFLGSNNKEYIQFIRLNPNDLAPTVMGKSRFIHPFEDRLLSVREQARLMGYPDTHVFYGYLDEQYNQVGEAVPIPLAKAIAKYVYRLL